MPPPTKTSVLAGSIVQVAEPVIQLYLSESNPSLNDTDQATVPVVRLAWAPLLIAGSWFHNRPRSMFMFWKVNVYSAPIRVGSLPAWREKVSLGTSLA